VGIPTPTLLNCALALASACLGVGLLRAAWGIRSSDNRARTKRWLTLAGWFGLSLGSFAWHASGQAWDKAVACAALVPALVALIVLAREAQWKAIAEKNRRKRDPALPEPSPHQSLGQDLLRFLLAGPLALIAALGITALVGLYAPWSDADRLVTAGLILPIIWALAAMFATMRWKLPRRVVAAALESHSAIGIILSALIYLVCLTGTISVLVDEIKIVEQPSPVAAPLAAGTLNKAVAAALSRQQPAPGALYAVAPNTPRQRLTLTAYNPGDEHVFIANTDGTLVQQQTPFADFITELHMTLTAPEPWGSLIVGIAGAALLSLIISGVVAHPRIFRDAFRLRLNGSKRLKEAELHNRLSVWGLPFHVAVTLSGALFGLANLAIMAVATLGYHGDTTKALAPLNGPQVVADARSAPLPDIEALVRDAQSRLPGSQLAYVGITRPGTAGAEISVEMGGLPRLPRGDDFHYDVQGHPLGATRYLTGSTGLQIYSGAAQVHFGFFGGLAVRIAYVILGSALTFITATGFTIWLERSAERGRHRPRLRRAWRAWTRGLLVATAVTALTSQWLPVSWTFWTVTLAAQALAAFRPQGNRSTTALGTGA
jgi:uncharacterized iron-regulated membrane protein